MDNTDISKVYDAINEIKKSVSHIGEQSSAHTIILNEVIKPDVTEIKEHLVKQNNRIYKLEKRVDARDIVCGEIQKGKDKSLVNWKWAVGISIPTLLTCIGLLYAGNKYLPDKSEKPMLIFEKIDSSHIKMAPLIMRVEGGYTIDTVNAVYLNISNLDKL